MSAHSSHGYALLVVMMLMAGVGGGWLSMTGSGRSTGTQHGALASHSDIDALIQARQSLLSYAALYPYLYGPAGSGPAHLPCPDTDAAGMGNVASITDAGHRRDGPNPPCSSPDGSRGRLPRHTVLPGYRYLFHAAPWQMFEYEVASEVVNNPTNRLVNMATLQNLNNVPVAWISLSLLSEQQQVARVPIMGSSMYRATAASVAAWLIQRVAMRNAEFCVSNLVNEAAGAEAVLDTDSDSDDTPIAAEPISAIDPASTDELGNCYPVTAAEGMCVDDAFFRRLLDTSASADDACLEENFTQYTMESTPAARHWFFRNRWYESIAVSAAGECLYDAPVYAQCHLQLISTPSYPAPLKASRIELQWQRSS